MWRKLIPREGKFFEMFNTMAENADATAALLVEMMESFDRLPDRASAIKGKEHLGDTLIHDLIRKLNSTFVTPLDREDIHHLASSMDDIVDLSDAAANKVILFDIRNRIEGAAELARVVKLQTAQIRLAVRALVDPKRILDHCIEIHRLENEGDRVFQEAMARLFKLETDPIQLIKTKEVLEALERATDTCEDAANVLEGIMVKNA
ncbi:MAG TPA: DUF47 family protein [Candidatus Polarisedimenticolia bacterium]|nr:DUF47 family protein [Candidatus Polarisedimenticolia bacterium]